jgi:hypothetical protein
MKICTSPTKEGIIKLINEYYYSTTFTVNFETGEVSNSKGIVKDAKVQYKKGRYIFEN